VLTFLGRPCLEIRASRSEDKTLDSVTATATRFGGALVDLGKEGMVRVDGDNYRTTLNTHAVKFRRSKLLVFKLVSQAL
jgi:hypothetical protein